MGKGMVSPFPPKLSARFERTTRGISVAAKELGSETSGFSPPGGARAAPVSSSKAQRRIWLRSPVPTILGAPRRTVPATTSFKRCPTAPAITDESDCHAPGRDRNLPRPARSVPHPAAVCRICR
jgi:hypothetical protein